MALLMGQASGHQARPAKPRVCSSKASSSQRRRSGLRRASAGMSKADTACATDKIASSEPLCVADQPWPW